MSGRRAALSVAVCQLTSIDDPQKNLHQILALLTRLESDVPDLVCFPENALYLRIRDGVKTTGIAFDDPVFAPIAAWAKAHRSVIHLGSVPLFQDGRVFNASLLFEADGSMRDLYHKIHLFDVDVDGQKPVRESDIFTAGEKPAVFSVHGWSFGSTICYDLRFSNLFLEYAKLEVDALVIPSAFLVPTGQAHWHVLTRARAIESQAYVLAPAQGGVHDGVEGGSRATYGHALVVDPWGEVIAEVPEPFAESQRILRAILRREKIDKVRAQIPMRNHRRSMGSP